jgi:hypothetical protein
VVAQEGDAQEGDQQFPVGKKPREKGH